MARESNTLRIPLLGQHSPARRTTLPIFSSVDLSYIFTEKGADEINVLQFYQSDLISHLSPPLLSKNFYQPALQHFSHQQVPKAA